MPCCAPSAHPAPTWKSRLMGLAGHVGQRLNHVRLAGGCATAGTWARSDTRRFSAAVRMANTVPERERLVHFYEAGGSHKNSQNMVVGRQPQFRFRR